MSKWKITNPASAPTMWCSSSEDISDAEARRLIKGLLRQAKQDKISIHAITISVDDDGQCATLFGTEQA